MDNLFAEEIEPPKNTEIDLLLGSHYLWDIVFSKSKIQSSEGHLVKTVFGTIVTGRVKNTSDGISKVQFYTFDKKKNVDLL